ncbi:1-acyl-sn-glycerol-3-phosphate acyltransferase [Candidatus Saccharibacteria bacterium]|nr:1-acyl-sn-glycerol-3-phosphate acyltransferase [Candidatus Saccharibacteria bacterium]MCB9820922.1 1-acyl-sn-glycerol-3-phosphate acyltransferase [Candidatus Nomurabacteria bacterium]
MKYLLKISHLSVWVYSKLLLRFYIQLEVDKRVTISSSRSKLFISNHTSLLDASLFIGSLTWREIWAVSPTRAILAKRYYYSPVLPFAYLIGCFPARPLFPSLKRYAGVAASVRYLNDSQSVGIYPEGKRTPNVRIEARNGIVRILSSVKAVPEIYLIKVTRESKRKFKIVIDRDDSVAKLNDPNKIMDKLFSL